ncbi:MAG: indole-3-glycerol-phosphate synthase TrpC, partial [Anaerolineae bacterium]|nr:indole-3-glycerol-phosphate synthase TrpC [Anaerolineae bacterium]
TQMADLHSLIVGQGMAALVEVHNEAEMERALRLNPALIGVNNRDLRTFHVDLQTTARLIGMVPGEVTFVAESGIMAPEDVRNMGELGAHAVLVGESLVRAGDDLAERVRAFSNQRRRAAS